jgi:surface-anchored protein
MSMRRAFVFIFLTAASLLTGRANADFLVEYSRGHGDIGLAIEPDGSLFLHYHFGVGSAVLNGVTLAPGGVDEYAPNEAVIRVPVAARSFPGAVPFLGTGASDPVWTLPSGSPGSLPFLGLAAEELDPLDFVSAGFRLMEFSGPAGGEFALWQGGFTPTVFFQTNNGINPAVDLYNISILSHDHANWSFTKEGIYNLTIQGFANPVGGGPQLTDIGTFTFAVGNATAVPEPSSIALIAIFGAGFFSLRKRFHSV